MIYSISIFFNEIDLLNLKIAEELPYVDKMIIVESTITFTGKPKPLNFPMELLRSNDKLIYLVANESYFNKCRVAWDRERMQRNYPQSVIQFEKDDILIVTDIDEIVVGKKIPEIVSETKARGGVGLHMQIYYYYLNTKYPLEWYWPFAVRGDLANRYLFDDIRNRRDNILGGVLKNSGKHFSYLGDAEMIKKKLQSFSHTEYDLPEYTDIGTISDRVKKLYDICGRGTKMEIVDIDESYPQAIIDNVNFWNKYIYKGE